MTENEDVIAMMASGMVDVEPGMTIEGVEPVHEVLRGMDVKVQDEKTHGFAVGMRVMFTGKGHDLTRGRVGIIKWTRHTNAGRLEVRVDYDPGNAAWAVRRDWDVFVGHETKSLIRMADKEHIADAAVEEIPVSDLLAGTGQTYGTYVSGIAGIKGIPGTENVQLIPIPQPGGTSTASGITITRSTFNGGESVQKLRDDVIGEAKTIISGDRADDYGDLQENFGRIATIWSAILGVEVPVEKVALMMAGVKIARLAGGKMDHRDSWVDIIGYAGLGAEVARVPRKDS
jgi:hypothetical protein